MTDQTLDRPSSPPTKTVSFASSPQTSSFASTADPFPSTSSSTTESFVTSSQSEVTGDTTATTIATTLEQQEQQKRPTTKRRRSSIKQGLQMPYKPPSEYYTHSDPLIRRLRLRDGYGKLISLEREFGRDAKLVLFFFG
jgi:hypothetical protein